MWRSNTSALGIFWLRLAEGIPSMQIFDAKATADRLPYDRLIPELATAMRDLRDGRIHACNRTVLPLPGGGSYLVMPCTDNRYAMTKLVTVTPANRALGLPTIQGRLMVSDSRTGTPLAVLDGSVVTARRTAAVTLLGIETLLGRGPQRVVLVGTGIQARAHAYAMGQRWPGMQLRCVGRTANQAKAFAQELTRDAIDAQATTMERSMDGADVVIAATTSLTPVLPDLVDDRILVVGVGSFTPQMAELPANQVLRRQVWVDDLAGAQHEAGDLLQAGVDWSRVASLADALDDQRKVDGPLLYKTVGHAAWDLAAVRTAMNSQAAMGAP
jgi:ornithine cyclodeaminase/alanine dehydrogenase-like protein (mu-crystallin family)